MVTVVEYPAIQARKSPSQRAGFFGALLPVLLFFTLANCILQIACQIVRITLGLVELAFGLHLLVARDLASGVLNRALGLVRLPQRVRGPCTTPVWDWCTDNVPARTAVPLSAKMPQAEQCALPKTSSASPIAAAEQQNQESRYC